MLDNRKIQISRANPLHALVILDQKNLMLSKFLNHQINSQILYPNWNQNFNFIEDSGCDVSLMTRKNSKPTKYIIVNVNWKASLTFIVTNDSQMDKNGILGRYFLLKYSSTNLYTDFSLTVKQQQQFCYNFFNITKYLSYQVKNLQY